MKPNPGHCPPAAIGKRVRVRLANGNVAGPWPADGKGGVRWSRSGHPFDISEFEVVA
ncbi:MAG: hypothetical protein M3Y22_00965 [Pseudomonadota bacterium]|nr:hypothetical protein [Pseudomonadota bacterium]